MLFGVVSFSFGNVFIFCYPFLCHTGQQKRVWFMNSYFGLCCIAVNVYVS